MQVEKKELEEVLELLKKAKELADYGDTKAYPLERRARELLEGILQRDVENPRVNNGCLPILQ